MSVVVFLLVLAQQYVGVVKILNNMLVKKCLNFLYNSLSFPIALGIVWPCVYRLCSNIRTQFTPCFGVDFPTVCKYRPESTCLNNCIVQCIRCVQLVCLIIRLEPKNHPRCIVHMECELYFLASKNPLLSPVCMREG